ncbi:hypothetical protein DK427_08715 [Methylobacterium radiodurans]|uniref:DUF2934 domain-containing protein n=1 Tax=Methylobacterium radiodurans TaxID=2202828 RepID=A0A2U8VQQ2_9HYPH|nr:hypothetical protein DK427_08715 [Methylobacterium radiodurans]
MVERVSRDNANSDPDAPSGIRDAPVDPPETRLVPDRSGTESDPISFEQIRERAYELWERNHRPEGLEIQFWLLAERELRAERRRAEG